MTVDPAKTSFATWLHRYRSALLMAMLALVVMLPSAGHDFLNWDDNQLVTDNPAVTTTAGIKTIWTSVECPKFYPNYPLTMTLYWLEHQLWGLDPTGYHVVNILLHALNAALVVIVMRRLGLREPASLLAAGLFAAHPMQVESVAWIAERKNVLFTFFSLLAILAYLKHIDTASRRLWAWSLLAFVAAVLSKTAAVTLPCTLVVTIWLKRGRVTARDMLWLMPFFGVSLLAGLVTMGVEAPPRDPMPLLWRPLLALNALAFYLARLVFPVVVVPVHPKWAFEPSGVFLLAPIALLVLAGLLFRYRRTVPPIVWWGAAHFLVSLGPFLGLIPFGYHETSYVADRFVYIAGIGLFAPLAVGITHALGRFHHRLAFGTCAAYVGIMAGVTLMYVNVWRDSLTFWQYTLRHNPDCARAHNNLGIELRHGGQPDLALAHYAYAMKADPKLASAAANYAADLAHLGDYDGAEAYYMRSISIEPRNPLTHFRLAWVHLYQERFEDALVHLRIASRLDPANPDVYIAAAQAHEHLGNLDKAEYLYRKTLEVRPMHPVAEEKLADVIIRRASAPVASATETDDGAP